MAAELIGFGIDDLNELIGGGIPRGSVVNITGPPGTGKTLVSLSFLSDGFRNEEQGVQVCFSTVPIVNVLKRVKDSRKFQPLLKTDVPVVMDLSDLDRVDILIGLIEDGEIERLVLDHPETMSLRNSSKWFTMFEELLASARTNKVTCMVVDYDQGAPAGVGKYVADGIISLTRSGTRIRAEVLKWDLDPTLVGREAAEEVSGDWTN
jgi:KaiC/GvpD/RAD55 family RecA-like ATPase